MKNLPAICVASLFVGMTRIAALMRTPGLNEAALPEENIGAAAVELTQDDLREIESAASNITVQGARYPEHIEQMSNR